MFQTNGEKDQNTHFMGNTFFFSPKIVPFMR